MSPHAAQPRKHVLLLGKLDLELALSRDRMHREDLEDECGAVDHACLGQELLDVDLLGRREFVIEDDEVGAEFERGRGDLVGLPRSDERARVGSVEPLRDDGDHVDLGRMGKALELGDRFLDRPFGVAAVDADEDRAVTVCREVLLGLWMASALRRHAKVCARSQGVLDALDGLFETVVRRRERDADVALAARPVRGAGARR